ncbi:MAG: MlaD family protein [Nitrospira sp.]|nr:MlaD family protein [Nitrospira sp.]
MFEGSREPDLTDIPSAVARPKRKSSPQLIWLIPIVAVLIGGWLAVKTILEKGPTITITFKTAEGIEAGKTKVKYKSIDIGEVKSVGFSKDLENIELRVEMNKAAASHLVEDVRFWIVKPRISGGQVSGIGTLFSGSYIEMDPGKSSTPREAFEGLEVQPSVTGDMQGRHFILHAVSTGSLEVGSPVYFRQEAVGRVESHQLNQDGQGVTFKIFVSAPYDQYVKTNTRFWNASGIDVTMDSTGIKVNTQSLTSILIGGIVFETLAGAPQPVAEENQEFSLADTRSEAMKRPDTLSLPFVFYFTQSLRGLSIGAAVEFRGIEIGEVTSMNVEVNETQDGFRFPVTVAIYPQRLLALSKAEITNLKQDEASRRVRWDRMVQKGLRGQLKSGNLLTGQLYLAVDFFPDAPPAQIDWTNLPPALPTMSGGLQALERSVGSILAKIDKMPIDDLVADLRQNLASLNRTLNSADKLVKRLDAEIAPQAKSTLEEARKTLTTVERTMASDAPLQQDLRTSLRELSRAAQSLRELTNLLERQPESLIRGKKESKR